MSLDFVFISLIFSILIVIGFLFFELYLYVVDTEKLKEEIKFNSSKNTKIRKKLY